MQSAIADMLAKRRDRVIAVILGVKERERDPHLPPYASARLRKVVLDQMNDYHDLCLDLIRGLDRDDSVSNEVYLDKLDELHTSMAEIQRILAVNSNGNAH